MRGCCVHCGHQNFLFFLLAHMYCGGPIINLQHNALLSFAEDLLVHDLNVLKAAAVLNLFVFYWDHEMIFENLEMQLFWFQLRQFL